MSVREVSLSSPIEEKIAWAESCYQEVKERLCKDKTILVNLSGLRNAIRVSRGEMARIGIRRICSECEEQEGGSCCGAGLEDRYDGGLLLINLLLGVRLPKIRHDPESCFFLGEAGCLLYARHVICINYLCKRITSHIDPREINLLREKEGQELENLFLLHEDVKRVSRGL